MQTSLTHGAPARAPRASGMSAIAAAGLFAMALSLGYVLAAIFGFATIPAVIAGLCVLFAGLSLAGFRWAPALGLLPALPTLAMFVPMSISDVGAPLFLPGLALAAGAAIAVIFGVAATAQNYRRAPGERRLPWAAPLVVAAVAGAALGAQGLALLPQPQVASGISLEVLASLPVIAGKDFEFDQKELRVRVGETVALRLENSDPERHSFDIDELNIHAPMPVGETGVALFKPTKPGVYTFYCAPHYDPASGEGMKGTLIVEE